METIILDAAKHGDTLVELIRSGGYVPLGVTGNSMMPLLHSGRDIVWLKACTPDVLTRGRIILFRRADGSFILHRIRKCMADGTLKMNGDAQTWCEIISRDNAVAVVEELMLRGKRISCRAPSLRIWDALWFPTRPIRPLLFRLYSSVKSCFRKQ